MAQTTEAIRLLRIRAVSEGLSAAAQQHDQLAQAMGRVADTATRAQQAQARVGEAVDRAAAKALNGLKQWEAYQRRTDEFSKAVQAVSRDMETVSRAFQQGHMGPRDSAQALARYNEELRKLQAQLDKVGVTPQIGAIIDQGNLQEARQQAAQVVQMRKDAMEFATQDAKRYAQLQGDIAEAMSRAMPMQVAQARLEKDRKDIAEARWRGIIKTDEQEKALLAEAQKRFDIQQRTHQISGGRLNRADVTNLGYQVNDIVTMLAAGAPLTQTMATQLPQIYQIVTARGGGLVQGVKDLGSAFLSLINPATLFFTGTATFLTAGIVSWKSYRDSIREVEASLKGLGRGTPATAAQLSGLAERAGDAAGITRGTARTGVAAMAATGRIDPAMMEDVTRNARDFAAVLGEEVPDALKTMAGVLADPARGVEDLDKRLNLFTVTERKFIQTLAEGGNRTAAAAAILERLGQIAEGAARPLTFLERSWAQMAQNVDEAGKGIEEMLNRMERGLRGPRNAAEAIQAMERQVAALEQSLKDNQAVLAQTWNPINRSTLADQIEKDKKALDELKAKLGEVRQQQQAQDQRRQGVLDQFQQIDLTKSLEPWFENLDETTRALRDLAKEILALDAALAHSQFSKMDPAWQARVRSQRQLAGAQEQQQLGFQAVGGQDMFNLLNQSLFGQAGVGQSDLNRGLLEIQQRFEELAQQALLSSKSLDEFNRRMETLDRARQIQERTHVATTGLNIARQTAPWQFQAFDLGEQIKALQAARGELEKLGVTSEQFADILSRLQERQRNVQTPLQEMVQSYRLEQMAIAATTLEQQAAVEAERALAQARKEGLNATEQAVAQEIARNNVIARANRQAYDSYRDVYDRAQTVGMRPQQQRQREIELQYQRQREQLGDSPWLRSAEELEKYIAAQEDLQQTLRDAADSIKEEVDLAEAQARMYGQTTEAIEGEIAAIRLRNQLLREGYTITPELEKNIRQYGQAAGAAKAYGDNVKAYTDLMDDFKSTGKDALKGFISDLKEGKSAGEAFLNLLQRIVDKLMNMMIDALFDTSGRYSIFDFLMGKKPSAASVPTPQFEWPSAPASATTPLAAPQPIMLGGQGGLINQNIAGSAVPPITLTPQAVAPIQINPETFGPITRAFSGMTSSLEAAAKAIRTIESGSPDGNYGAIGPLNRLGTDRAYGAYQVMGNNVGPWTQQHFGQRLSIDEFLRNPAAQDAVFRGQFGEYMDRFGVEGAGQAWIGGPGSVGRNLGRTDVLGTSIGGYGSRFGRLYQQYGGGTDALRGSAGLDRLGDSVENAAGSFDQLNPSLGTFGNQFQTATQTLQNTVPQLNQQMGQLPSMIGQGGQQVGGALTDTSQTIMQGSDGIGGALSNLMKSLQSGGGGGGGLGGLFSGLFGGGGGGFANFDPITGSVLSIVHEGGRIGHGGGRLRPMTLMDQIAFMSAPRLHGGTLGGLKPDERRAILQTDEVVLSRDDVQAATRRGRSAPSSSAPQSPVNVNVINNGPGEARVERKPNGDIDVIVEQAEARMAERAKRGRGPLVKAIPARQDKTALIG